MITCTKPRSRSRGLTVVAVLVCLVVITLVSSAVLKTVVAQREFARGRERRLQAEWLVESGLERVRARLDLDRDYTGETWALSTRDLGLPEEGRSDPAAENAAGAAAVVSIAVERVPGDALRRQVRVQADYPRDAPRRARQSRQMLIDLKPKKAGVAP
jgi:type II secretory pathway pseudopilin PulG